MRRILTLLALALGPVLVLGIFFVLPVGSMLGQGFFVDGRLDLAGVGEVLGRSRTLGVLWFTLWSATLGTLLTLLLGVPAAFVLHRLAIPGAELIRALLIVPFVLPTVVVGVAFGQLLAGSGPLGGLGLDGSPVAIVAALVFFNIAVVIRVVGAAWAELDPRPGEAAAALGASPGRVWWTITLPMLRPAVVSAGCVVFLFCATAFGVVLTLGGLRYSTVETEIYLLTTVLLDLPGAAALSVLQLVTVTGLLLVAARTRRPGPLRRMRVRRRRPRLLDIPALLLTALALLLVCVPIGSLLLGSLQTPAGWSLDNYRNLATAGSGNLIPVPVTTALTNSVRNAIDATWIALLLGLLVALTVTRRSHTPAEARIRGVLDGLFMLPLGVSAVTLGFGFLISLDEPPLDLRSSPLLVPIAQALVALPLVVRTIVPVLASIDDRQRQAAASLGAGPLRALATVDLPVLVRPVAVAIGFAFASSLGEFGATSFLARNDHPTLPIVIYRLIGSPGLDNYGMALAASVVLAAATALVLGAVEVLARSRAPARERMVRDVVHH